MNYSKEILRLTKTFDGTKYDIILKEVVQAYIEDDFKKLEEHLNKFPTDIQMLGSIVEKVKGKSVERNIKIAINSGTSNVVETLIAVSSLMTHVAIECKQNREFRALLPDLHNKLGELIHHV
jgi:hypothetical protein